MKSLFLTFLYAEIIINDSYSFTKEEISLLNQLAYYVDDALNKSILYASQNRPISNDLKSSQSVQIIPYLNYADDLYINKPAPFHMVLYLAITSDYCVVLRFVDTFDDLRYNFIFKNTTRNIIEYDNENTVMSTYSNGAAQNYDLFPYYKYSRFLGSQIVWIPNISPSSPNKPSTSMFESGIGLPFDKKITLFRGYSSIGQNSLKTLMYSDNKKRPYTPYLFYNFQNIYKDKYDKYENVPVAIFYHANLDRIYTEYQIKWMPTTEYSENDYLRSYYKSADNSKLIAYDFIDSTKYFENFFSFNPKYLDDMRKSIVRNNVIFPANN